MMFRCVQGKIGGSSEDNGGGAALGAPSARWSKVVHRLGAVWSEAPEPRLEGCAQPTVQGQSVAL